MIERKYSDWVQRAWQNNHVSVCFMKKKEKENVLSDVVAHFLSRQTSVCHIIKCTEAFVLTTV